MNSSNFISVSYSNPDVFTQGTSQVALRQYEDDIAAYIPFDATFNTKYGFGVSTPAITGSPSLYNFGQFAQCVKLNGSLTYSATNFQTLGSTGSIKFWLKATFNLGYGTQNFINTAVATPFTAGTYGFTLTVGAYAPVQVSFALLGTESIANIYSSVSSNVAAATAHALTNPTVYAGSGVIQIKSVAYGDTITITPPSSGNSLITLLGGVGSSLLLNAPTADTTLFSIKGATNANRIDLIHKATTSNIVLAMYNSSGTLVVNSVLGVWSNFSTSFYAFELSFNPTMAQLFVNGSLMGMCITNFTRSVQSDGALILNWNGVDLYEFDEFIVYNVYKHIQNYTPEAVALTQYSTITPYADIDFGTGYGENTISGITIDASTNTNYVAQVGNQFYYYFNGAWRASDGTYSQSMAAAVLESKISSLYTDATLDFSIRVYFESDGITPSYLNAISLIKDLSGVKQATITGTVSLFTPVDLTSFNQITVSTELGSTNVTLTGATQSAVTLAEIKASINAASVPGLALATDDDNGHLVLKSANTGANSFVAVGSGATKDAVFLVWGNPSNSSEVDANLPSLDYTSIFTYIRSRLGAPTVPVELTDEQLENLLAETVTEYNRWRNYREELMYMTLPPNMDGGYTIPPVIGDPNTNIVDIIVRPTMPFGYYSADTDMASNLYMQYMFQKFGRPGQVGFLGDYWMALSTEKDMNIILGTEVRWEILNRSLYITPRPKASLAIGIKYRASLTVNEILSDNLIKRYLLGLSKILLGNIRGTFGGTIPGGTENIQLNSSELIRQGEAELEKAQQQMIGQSEPQCMLIG